MDSSLSKTTQQFFQNLSLSQKVLASQEIEDPFLSQGGQLVYNQEHDFIIRMQEKPNQIQTLKNMEKIRVKIVVNQLHGVCKNLKIELSSDTQLYFNFTFNCSDWQWKRIKQNQNMFIDFKEYPQIVVKGFNRLKNSQQDSKYLAVFTVFTQKQGKLDIIRKAQFRDDSILQFEFFKASQEHVKKSIQYRFDLMRQQHQIFSQRYGQITELIKSKNPSLMMQISKSMKKGK